MLHIVFPTLTQCHEVYKHKTRPCTITQHVIVPCVVFIR
jgi:hypothetical protein